MSSMKRGQGRLGSLRDPVVNRFHGSASAVDADGSLPF